MARTKKSESKLPVGMTRRRDGRIMNRFTFEGKRYTVYGGSKDECREKEVQKREELKAGMYKSGKALTVKEYSERWIESKRGTVKETTIRLNTILCRRITETVIDRAGTKFGTLKLEKGNKGFISIFAYGGGAEGVSLKGFKYNIFDTDLSAAYPLGLSNELMGLDAEIVLMKGSLLIVYEREYERVRTAW